MSDYTDEDVLRAAKAEAWDEGYTAGFYDREYQFPDATESHDASEGRTTNPYRATGPTTDQEA